jgi:hypothetical protein
MARSDGGTRLWTESGVIEAPIDQVARCVLEVHPGPIGPDNALLLHRDRPRSAMVLEGGPTHYSGRLARLGGTGGGGARRPERDGTRGSGGSRDVEAKWERIRYAESLNPKNRDYSFGGRNASRRRDRGAGRNYDLPIIEIDVDRPRRRLIVQGHWWFRGEYRLLPHADGTLLEYVAYNRAEVPTALMRFLHRGMNRKQRNNLEAALNVIGTILGCRAYPVR